MKNNFFILFVTFIALILVCSDIDAKPVPGNGPNVYPSIADEGKIIIIKLEN